MRFTFCHAFLTLILGGFLIGCANVSDTTSAPDLLDTAELTAVSSQSQSNRHLWGFWTVSLDPTNGTSEVVPLREATFRVDVVAFLQPPMGSLANINITIVDMSEWETEGRLDVDVALTHPFPGLDQYSGFDVMGVLISPGGLIGQHDSDISYSDGMDDIILLNADGYTRWYNPDEWASGTGIFDFVPGALGMGSGNIASLNGYKYFATGLNEEDDVGDFFQDADNCARRGVFTTTTLRRRYELECPIVGGSPALSYQYTVVASWVPPDPGPLVVPDSFPEEANAAEPFNISVTDDSDAFYTDTLSGGNVRLFVEVFDWNAYLNGTPVRDEVGAILLESSTGLFPLGDGVFDDPGSLDWAPAGPASSTVEIEFPVTPTNALDQDVLIMVISADPTDYDTGGGGFPQNAELAAYKRMTISVTDAGTVAICTPPDPEFASRTTETTAETFTENPINTDLHPVAYEWDVTLSGEDPVWPGVPTGSDNTYVVNWVDETGGTEGDYSVHVRVYDEIVDTWTACFVDVTVDPAAGHPWPMMGHDYQGTGRSEYAGPSVCSEKWNYPTGGAVVDSMAIDSDGNVYFGSNSGSIYAIDTDGNLVWSHPTGDHVKSAPALGPTNELYIGSNVGRLFCFNRANGDIIWSEDLPNAIICGVTVLPNGWVCVGCHDGRYRAFSWDGATVTEEWYVQTGAYIAGTAAYFNDCLYVPSTDGYLYCVDPSDGTVEWQYSAGGSYTTGMAINDDGILFIGTQTGRVRALDTSLTPSDVGFVVWAINVTGGARSACSLLPDGDVIVGTLSGYLYRLDKDTGNTIWSHDYGPQIVGASAIDANGKVYFGCYNGNFYCIDGTGTSSPPPILWQSYLGTSGPIGVAAAPAIDADGTVFIGSSLGPMYAFEVP